MRLKKFGIEIYPLPSNQLCWKEVSGRWRPEPRSPGLPLPTSVGLLESRGRFWTVKISAWGESTGRLGDLSPDKADLGSGPGPFRCGSFVDFLYLEESRPNKERWGREQKEEGVETQAARPRLSPPAAGRARQHQAEAPSAALWFSLCAALKRAKGKMVKPPEIIKIKQTNKN